MRFWKNLKPSATLELKDFSQRFTGAIIRPADYPYFSEFLDSIGKNPCNLENSIESFVALLPPRNLFEIRREIKNLRTPGVALTSFDNTKNELSYTSSCLKQFLASHGLTSVPDPGKFCVQVLAMVSTFLEGLPNWLKHLPSVSYLSVIAQTLSDHQEIDSCLSEAEKVKLRQNCIDRLSQCFRQNENVFSAQIHEDDAATICALSWVPFAEGQASQALFDVFNSLRGVSPQPLDTETDREFRLELARRCYEDIFVKQMFPALAIGRAVYTYSGEEA